MFAPPGVDLRRVEEKMRADLGAELWDIEKPGFAKIRRPGDPREGHRPTQAGEVDMNRVTHNLPRTEVARLWTAAAADCVSQLSRSTNSIRLLCGHLTYYSAQRREFYSAVDLRVITAGLGGAPPAAMLLILDDVYDMYRRLDQLYPPPARRPVTAAPADTRDGRDEEMAEVTARSVQDLLHLLSWRYFEYSWRRISAANSPWVTPLSYPCSSGPSSSRKNRSTDGYAT